MNTYSQSDLLGDLVGIFPDFAAAWRTDIAGDADPSKSLHSIYMSFLPFLAHAQPTPKQWQRLADLLSESVAAGGNRENAVDTCFFEAIGKTAIARQLRPLLSREAGAYVRS